jgi:hypothetical protein
MKSEIALILNSTRMLPGAAGSSYAVDAPNPIRAGGALTRRSTASASRPRRAHVSAAIGYFPGTLTFDDPARCRRADPAEFFEPPAPDRQRPVGPLSRKSGSQWTLGIEARGRSIEEIDAALAKPAINPARAVERIPPPGTIIWTCGWWVIAEPQL